MLDSLLEPKSDGRDEERTSHVEGTRGCGGMENSNGESVGAAEAR